MNTFLTLDQVRVGQRVRLEEVLYPDGVASKPGDVVEISPFRGDLPDEFDSTGEKHRHYLSVRIPGSIGSHFWGRVSALEEDQPTSSEWVLATPKNVHVNSRIRWTRSDNFLLSFHGEGTVVDVGDGCMYVLMDNPGSKQFAQRLSPSTEKQYNWASYIPFSGWEVSVTAPEPSDFTPAQQEKIRTLALRYADEHGYDTMVSEILTELGIPETPTPIHKRARITVTFETDLEGQDGFTLPEDSSRLNGMLLRTHAREAVEALIPSRIGLSDQVDIILTSVSYLDTDIPF